MELAKNNDWGFGVFKNKQERDEEIKTFATIVTQIGIHPQLSASRNAGEIVFSDNSSSDINHSIEDKADIQMFKKAAEVNVGSKKSFQQESKGSLIFGDSKHEIKLQKRATKVDKYLSFHGED